MLGTQRRLLRQVIDEPARLRRLKRRTTHPQPGVTVTNAVGAIYFRIGPPIDLGESRFQRRQREGNTGGVGGLRRQFAHRGKKTGEHEVIAQIPCAVEVVPEMNPHAERLPRLGSEGEDDFEMSPAVNLRSVTRRQLFDLPAVIEGEIQISTDVRAQSEPRARDEIVVYILSFVMVGRHLGRIIK